MDRWIVRPELGDDVPHFMALRLSDKAPYAGAIRYPAAFDRLS